MLQCRLGLPQPLALPTRPGSPSLSLPTTHPLSLPSFLGREEKRRDVNCFQSRAKLERKCSTRATLACVHARETGSEEALHACMRVRVEEQEDERGAKEERGTERVVGERVRGCSWTAQLHAITCARRPRGEEARKWWQGEGGGGNSLSQSFRSESVIGHDIIDR